MIQFQAWPPPEWAEIVVTWDEILDGPTKPQDYYDWCDAYDSTGRYHVHGWKSTEGFAFRFERPGDATLFALYWS